MALAVSVGGSDNVVCKDYCHFWSLLLLKPPFSCMRAARATRQSAYGVVSLISYIRRAAHDPPPFPRLAPTGRRQASREPAPKCPGWYEEDEPKKPAASKPKQPAQQQQQQQKPAKEQARSQLGSCCAGVTTPQCSQPSHLISSSSPQAAKPAGEKAPAGKGKGKEGAGPTAPAVPPGLQPPAPQEPRCADSNTCSPASFPRASRTHARF